MKCRNCGKEIPDNSIACPDCGTETGNSGLKLGGDVDGYFQNGQHGEEQNGFVGSLPPQNTKAEEAADAVKASAPARKTKKAAPKEKVESSEPETAAAQDGGQTEKKETDLTEMVKDFGKKAGNAAKKLGGRAAGAAKSAASKVSDAAGEAADKAQNKGGLKTILITAAAVVVVVLVIAGILSIPGGKNEEEFYTLGAVVDNELYVLNGEKLIPLYDDLADEIAYNDMYQLLATVDYKSYYFISDAEYDEDTYNQVGDLILIGKNGKYQDIDKDVIAGSMQTAGKVLWYAKLKRGDVILCSCVGTKVTEVAKDIDYGQDYIGSPDAKKAFFNIIDKEKSVACFAQGGKVEELADNAYIVGVSEDYKQLLWIDEDDDLYLYDGKGDNRIAKSVYSIVYDPKTMNCLVTDSDGELSYIQYGKKAVDIDDDVESILVFEQGYIYPAYMDRAPIGSHVYYYKDGHLYKADLKGKAPERIIKNFYNDVFSSWVIVDNDTIYWADDDEINSYNLKNNKTDRYKLDAEDLSYANLSYYDGMFLFINEDDELMAAKYGDKKPRLINDDAEEIQYFYYLNQRVYYVDDDDLYLSPMKANAGQRLIKNFSEFALAHDKTIYVLADEGKKGSDLYIITKSGKAKEIATKVQFVFDIR